MRPVLEALVQDEELWEEVGIPHGPGRRFTLIGVTVAGFHLFVTEDLSDPRPGALVVFGVDVWLEDFDWTIVRAAVLKDEPGTDKYTATNTGPITKINRADAAAALVDQLADSANSRGAISVSN